VGCSGLVVSVVLRANGNPCKKSVYMHREWHSASLLQQDKGIKHHASAPMHRSRPPEDAARQQSCRLTMPKQEPPRNQNPNRVDSEHRP
jgi:hypothetical protein